MRFALIAPPPPLLFAGNEFGLIRNCWSGQEKKKISQTFTSIWTSVLSKAILTRFFCFVLPFERVYSGKSPMSKAARRSERMDILRARVRCLSRSEIRCLGNLIGVPKSAFSQLLDRSLAVFT